MVTRNVYCLSQWLMTPIDVFVLQKLFFKIWTPFKSTPVKSVPTNLVLRKSIPSNFAPLKSAPDKSAPLKLENVIIAFLRLVPVKLAPEKLEV